MLTKQGKAYYMGFARYIRIFSREYSIVNYKVVLRDAIGPDYHTISFQNWPDRAKMNGYPVTGKQSIPDFLRTLFLTYRTKYRPGRRRFLT